MFRGIDDTMIVPDKDGEGLMCIGQFLKDATQELYSSSTNTTSNYYNLGYCSTYDGVCTDYFNTFSASLLQMFILITTANYPDIMMPVYRCSNLSAIFFVTFLVL